MTCSSHPSVLVLVTNQASCERLIRTGASLKEDGQAVRVLSIQPRSEAPSNSKVMEHLFSVASSVGADMAVYYSDAPVETTRMYIRRYDIKLIVVGSNPSGSSLFITQLHSTFPDLPIAVIMPDSSIKWL
ncbi:MAG: hypothetical protein ACOYIR_06075 [Christensenellales bacterium]|jgi:K+-sensing histidine kinase KdpD